MEEEGETQHDVPLQKNIYIKMKRNPSEFCVMKSLT